MLVSANPRMESGSEKSARGLRNGGPLPLCRGQNICGERSMRGSSCILLHLKKNLPPYQGLSKGLNTNSGDLFKIQQNQVTVNFDEVEVVL